VAEAVGLVVAGAGARGAYEAGAMSVLVPSMVASGSAPRLLFGTSAGALNVLGLAGLVHLGWQRAVEALIEMWADVSLEQVVDIPRSVVGTGVGYAAQLAGLPVRLPSLLDTAPQRETLSRLLDLDQLHDNIRTGPIDAVGIVTTAEATRGTVVFVEKKPGVELPPPDEERNITYVETELTVEHALASAAVPVAFRPVDVRTPQRWRGWYVDGGLRLNVPLKPAIDFGCDRLGVVATSPIDYRTGPPSAQPHGARRPDVFSVASMALRSLLADRMIEDLANLTVVNELVSTARQARYRHVDFQFAGPPLNRREDIARLANEVFSENYAGLRGIRNPSLWVLNRLIGGSATDSGELMSFLFFDSAFTRASAELGIEHARVTVGEPGEPSAFVDSLAAVSG
jgi:NTE family protein